MPNKPAIIRERNQKQTERLDSLIKRDFIASNMSNAKWVKLLQLAAAHSSSVPAMNYKLVNEQEMRQSFNELYPEQVEEQWFREPILYKEVEWVEFPYKHLDAPTNTWAVQDLSALKAELMAAAQFPIQETESGLRVTAYVRA